MACQLEIDAEYELIEHVIMATKEELSRLQRHPGLFPNDNIRVEFWRSVWQTCNELVESIIPKQEARDHQHKMIQAAKAETEEDVRIPGRDVQRKPWEQFLHNRAPGTEADLSIFAEDGSLQIVPMAATRLLMTNICEYRDIIHDIEAVSTLHLVVSTIPPYGCKQYSKLMKSHITATWGVQPESAILRKLWSLHRTEKLAGRLSALTQDGMFKKLRAK